MKIADVFVKLGIKGDGKVTKAFENIHGSIKSISKRLLIIGGLLAGTGILFRKLTGSSAKAGQELKQFNDITGLSTKSLQKWEFAGSKFNATSQDIRSSIASVHQTMQNITRGKGAPEGFGIFARIMGTGLDRSKMQDTFYMLKKLQQLAMKSDADLKSRGFNRLDVTNTLRSFGLTDSVISAMKRGAFSEKNFQGFQSFSLDNKQIENLRQINAQWLVLTSRMEKLLNIFTTQFSPALIKWTNQFLDIIDAFSSKGASKDISKASKYYVNDRETISKIIKAIFNPISTALSPVHNLLSNDIEKTSKFVSDIPLSISNHFQVNGGRPEEVTEAARKGVGEGSKDIQNALRKGPNNQRGN